MMMRWLNQAEIVLKNTKTEDLHFYFFEGNDLLGMAACYNLRMSEPWESTVEYGDDQGFEEEIIDMMDIKHYEIVQNKWERLRQMSDGSWYFLSAVQTIDRMKGGA